MSYVLKLYDNNFECVGSLHSDQLVLIKLTADALNSLRVWKRIELLDRGGAVLEAYGRLT